VMEGAREGEKRDGGKEAREGGREEGGGREGGRLGGEGGKKRSSTHPRN
jgi:hypothetical protein